MGPCGPASAQRGLARRALALGWAIGGAGGPAPPLVAGRPRALDVLLPEARHRSDSASLNLNLTWPVPWILASESPS